MKDIMVMGAGAVGGYFGARLAAGAPDRCRVSFIARGEHLRAMQREGLKVQSPEGDLSLGVRAFREPADAPAPDLVLLCVKSHDTAVALEQLRPAVEAHTVLLSLQNGVENEDLMAEAFGDDRVLHGVCRIGAGLERPGVIVHSAMGKVTVGAVQASLKGAAGEVAGLFQEAGVPCELSGDIRREIWVKFAWNTVFNMITGLGEVTVDRLLADPQGEALCRRVFGEVRRVAAAEGVTLDEGDESRVIDGSRGLTGFVTSTLRDRRQGKPMEFEAFAGAMVRLADSHGMEVPAVGTLYALYRQLDYG